MKHLMIISIILGFSVTAAAVPTMLTEDQVLGIPSNQSGAVPAAPIAAIPRPVPRPSALTRSLVFRNDDSPAATPVASLDEAAAPSPSTNLEVPLPVPRPHFPSDGISNAAQDLKAPAAVPNKKAEVKAKADNDVSAAFKCPAHYTQNMKDALRLLDSVAGIDSNVLNKPFYIKTIAPAARDSVVPGSASLSLQVRQGVVQVRSLAQISAYGGIIKTTWDQASAVQICMKNDKTFQARTVTSQGAGNTAAKETTYTVRVIKRGQDMYISDDKIGPDHMSSEASLISSAAK